MQLQKNQMPKALLRLLPPEPNLWRLQLRGLPQPGDLLRLKKQRNNGVNGPQPRSLRPKDLRRQTRQRLQLQEIQLPKEILWMLPSRPEVWLKLQMWRMQKREPLARSRQREATGEEHCKEGTQNARNLILLFTCIDISSCIKSSSNSRARTRRSQ